MKDLSSFFDSPRRQQYEHKVKAGQENHIKKLLSCQKRNSHGSFYDLVDIS